jgi:hypothetical protein
MALGEGLSIAGGVIIGKLVEKPALELRDRLFPSDASAVPEKSPLASAVGQVDALR